MNHPLWGRWETELKPNDKLVDESKACPQCGERRADKLFLAEGRVAVDCETCGCVFIPEEKEVTNGTYKTAD